MNRRVLPCISIFVFASAFAVSVIAQEMDTAYVPFVVNVDAEIFAVGEGVIVPPIHVTANKPDTLIITVAKGGFASILNGARTRMNTPALMSGSHGKISLNLPSQSYKKADISLYSINGKRILRGRADASRAVKNISRPNLVAGVYLLSVKGTSGNSFSSRLTHRGGSLDISVAFGVSENNLTGNPVAMAKAAAESDGWTITVSANGYRDSSYTLNVLKGDNELQTIILKTVPDVNGCSGGDHFNPDITYGCFTDTRGNGQSYRTVDIDGKTWFAENLNYAGTGNDIGVCYLSRPDSCAKYGRLYTWTEAMDIGSEYSNTLWSGIDVNHQGVCPVGWHVPLSYWNINTKSSAYLT